MPNRMGAPLAVVAVSGLIAGCASSMSGVNAVKAGGGEMYAGAGSVVRRPFHELNLMQDKIAPVLLRAESRPYDLRGVNSCNDILDRVAELDLALGPDVDTPKEKRRSRAGSGAHFAAQTAMDAAGSAADHFIPVRGVLEVVSGSKRYQRQVAHATLAGHTRRSFLKAVGMTHDCAWPAAPMSFVPSRRTDPAADWNAAPRPGSAPLSIAVNQQLLIPPVTPAPILQAAARKANAAGTSR